MNQEKQPEALPEALKIANTCREARIDVDCPLFQSTALADAEYAICKMHTRIADLEAKLSAIGAGGVESLRKRECLQQSADAPGFADMAEVWRHSAEDVETTENTPSAVYHQGVAEGLRACARDLDAALQASPPAPQGEKAYEKLPEPAATGLGDEYESFDRDGRAMGKAYETILYFTADQMRDFADVTHALRAPAQEHATQLAGQGRQDGQQTWSIHYADERDFCLAASPLIGATYVVGKDAVKRLNESAWGRSHFGKVSASGPSTTPARAHKDKQA